MVASSYSALCKLVWTRRRHIRLSGKEARTGSILLIASVAAGRRLSVVRRATLEASNGWRQTGRGGHLCYEVLTTSTMPSPLRSGACQKFFTSRPPTIFISRFHMDSVRSLAPSWTNMQMSKAAYLGRSAERADGSHLRLGLTSVACLAEE